MIGVVRAIKTIKYIKAIKANRDIEAVRLKILLLLLQYQSRVGSNKS